MKIRVFSLTFLLLLLSLTIRADDDRQVWAAQMAGGAVLNAKDAPFNAKGDGVTDDTVALQSAIAAASASSQGTAKILLVPPGTYLLSSTLRVTNSRYFRMVGGGGATNLLWRGNLTDPALAITNVSFSEFSDFAISAGSEYPLQTGILLTNDPSQPGQSTANIFRNIGIGSTERELSVGLQIGRPENGELENDRHTFINCNIRNFTDKGVVVRSPAALDLLFYNLLAAGHDANAGLDLQGGSLYWLNGGVCNVQTGFVVTAPTGPIEINLTNEEGVGTMMRASAPAGTRFNLGLDNNRFANSPHPDFITIDGPGNIRINRNNFNNYPDSPNGFSILRTGAAAGDGFEFQYNRIFGFSTAQATTSAGLFSGQQPTLSCENHYWGWPVSELVAGQYDSTTTTPPAGDSTELDRQLARLRNLSNSQALFVGRITNRKTRDSETGVVGGVVDVRQAPYNAKGDGVTDDTHAFQLALQDLQLNGWTNGLLLVPEGNYVVSDTLLVGKSASGFDLVGEGSGKSQIFWSGTEGAVLDFAGVYHGEIRGIGINLTAGAKADIGLRIRALSYWDTITLHWAAAFGGSRNSIADVSIDGSAGTLTSALRVGDDASVPSCDLNNDFHVFQDVTVRGYRNTGIDVMNSQIYNLMFLDCRVVGAPVGAGFASQTGVKLVAGTLAWFGGGGQNHAVTALEIITNGNAPVLFHDATFIGSPQLLNTGPPNFSVIFLGLDHIRFTSNGTAAPFMSFSRPGVIVVENCLFELNNAAQTLHHFGDYSSYFPPQAKAAYQSLNGFAFLGNIIALPTTPSADFFAGSPPTTLFDNQFLLQDPVKPLHVTVFIKVIP